MTSFQCTNIQGDFAPVETTQKHDECGFSSSIDMTDSLGQNKFEAEFHLASDTVEASPRTTQSGASSIDVLPRSNPKHKHVQRSKSARSSTPATTNRLSSIPLPVKSSGPIKVPPLLKNVKTPSKTSSHIPNRSSAVANKHTLEIQFINKNKRYVQLRKELIEKQRPVLDLYQNLIQIKKRLEELGKAVKLEEIKLLTYEEYKRPSELHGSGEAVSMEVVDGMKNSIEEIPKTLMEICKNLLSRRALIVELLESVTKSEVDLSEVSDKIESLKNEGQQLQQSLDAIIKEHQEKIDTLVGNWQKLLNDKQCYNTDNKIEELESKVEDQQRLIQDSSNLIHDLHRKLEERKTVYDRSVTDLNSVIQSLKDQIKKLEQDLENEKKTSGDFKNRNTNNAQNLKTLRAKISELENEKTEAETSNSEMQKKLRLLQEQIKHKESTWSKERDELNKNLKHQENLLQKLTAEKNQFETRFTTIENEKKCMEDQLLDTISSLDTKLADTNTQLEEVTKQKKLALDKCAEFKNYVAKMGFECKETMNKVSYSIEWGKGTMIPAAENYIEEIAKDLQIRELEDKIKHLEEKGIVECEEKIEEKEILQTKPMLPLPHQQQNSNELLLEESKNQLKQKLNDLKSTEIKKLQSEIRQLKVRQIALEEQNNKCSTGEIRLIVEKGAYKINELVKRSMESEYTVKKYVNIIEKQTNQITEMEKLLRFRDNMAHVLKTSRDELILEKQSLTKYSHEIRSVLAEVTKQVNIKDRLARELQDKLRLREKQIDELTYVIKKLETKLITAHEMRFRLQEKIGILEKQLKNTKGHVYHLEDLNSQYRKQLKYLDLPSSHSHATNSNSLLPYQIQNSQNSEHQFFSTNISENVISDKTVSSRQKNSPDVSNNVMVSSTSRKLSNHKLTYQNISILSDCNSDHTNCGHKVNSRSLISLSLQTVDFLKTRLNYLTSVNMVLPEKNQVLSECKARTKKCDQTSTSEENRVTKRTYKANVSKILQLSAKRYKYLQAQANESYEDLTKLVKLAAAQESNVDK